MGEQSGIEWTTATWNPVIGCAKVSPACTNCYAEEYAAKRLKRPELWRGARHVTSRSVWNLPERVDRKAAREGRRVRLFVSSLADVFEDHPVWTGLRSFAFAKLEALEHTDVLLLTKRPENIRSMVPSSWLDAWPAHVWTGATVEDQQRADERISELLTSRDLLTSRNPPPTSRLADPVAPRSAGGTGGRGRFCASISTTRVGGPGSRSPPPGT